MLQEEIKSSVTITQMLLPFLWQAQLMMSGLEDPITVMGAQFNIEVLR